MSDLNLFNFCSIGRIESCFPEKFGAPKQAGLAPAVRAKLILTREYGHETFLRGLECCSHVWVIFVFHLNKQHGGATVRPPVLGGQKRMGIFSTRSPHRPNPIGLSLVKLESVQLDEGCLHISGHDFVDGTPVLDIKPYVAGYDCVIDSVHWSQSVEQTPLEVQWSEKALQELQDLKRLRDREAIEQILQLDPRPRSRPKQQEFGMAYAGLNFRFKVIENRVTIFAVSERPIVERKTKP
jgi:tRNA-Thr(GGU) m(6)t(6)A37 methyltransferase TsaA